jgi:hypothetical protein
MNGTVISHKNPENRIKNENRWLCQERKMHWLTRVLEKTENLLTTIQTIFSTEDKGRM